MASWWWQALRFSFRIGAAPQLIWSSAGGPAQLQGSSASGPEKALALGASRTFATELERLSYQPFDGRRLGVGRSPQG